jgi:hypothetical protein
MGFENKPALILQSSPRYNKLAKLDLFGNSFELKNDLYLQVYSINETTEQVTVIDYFPYQLQYMVDEGFSKKSLVNVIVGAYLDNKNVFFVKGDNIEFCPEKHNKIQRDFFLARKALQYKGNPKYLDVNLLTYANSYNLDTENTQKIYKQIQNSQELYQQIMDANPETVISLMDRIALFLEIMCDAIPLKGIKYIVNHGDALSPFKQKTISELAR